MPDRQETFDTVVAHLCKQGAKAERPNPSTEIPICLYRAPDGKKCAAGCLIPDDRYDPDMEFTAVGASDSSDRRFPFNPVTRVLMSLGHEIALVIDLQNIHDDVPVIGWEEEFRQVAVSYGLDYMAPQTIRPMTPSNHL